jgi:gliding motility-associated-like protein
MRIPKLTLPWFISIVILTCLSINCAYAQNLGVSGTITSNPSPCNGKNGIITLSATGGTPPYQYSLYRDRNFQTSNVFTNLAFGWYTFYVIDANGGVGSVKVDMRDDNTCRIQAIALYYSSPICGPTGYITVGTPYGGTAPYQWSLDGINFQNHHTFNNLGPGIYNVTVKDATGATKVLAFQLESSCPLSFTYVAVEGTCKQNNGSLTITASNGTPPYAYSVDGINFQTGNVFTGLAAAGYVVTVRDAAGYIVNQLATVHDNCPTLSCAATIETCQLHDGAITATGMNGTPPYLYSIDGVNFQTNNVFTGLDAGNYTITLKDASGASTVKAVTVKYACVNVSAVSTNSDCGKSNGSIVISATTGTAPYLYSMDGVNYQPGNSFTGISGGPYRVYAKDATGIIGSTAVTINTTGGPGINATATPALCNSNAGTISISASGGVTPYQFSIDGANYQNSSTFNNLASKGYTAWVKDASGCAASQTVFVNVSNNLTLTVGANTTICEGTTTDLNCTSNGTSFNWSPATGLSDPAVLNPMASPAVTTTYKVTASLGQCIMANSVTVFVNPAPVADAGNGTTICYGESAQLSGSGGSTYNWTPAIYLSNAAVADPDVQHPSSTTTYALTVTNGNGCKSLQPATVTISVTPLPKVFAGNDTTIVMNQPFTLQPKDINNSGFTQYTWSPSYGLNNSATQNPIALLDRNITYTVSASTPQGCSATDEINLKVYQGPEIYVPNAFSPNGDGHNDVLKAIPVGVTAFSFNIYNRWGQLIFSTKDPSRGWNGHINNTPASGTFVWMAEGLDAKGNIVKRSGTVILVR